MYKDLLDLPPEVIYYILGFVDKRSLLKFGEVNKATWILIQDTLLRQTINVFPYRAPIPIKTWIPPEHNPDPSPGTIICVEKPGLSLCSLDIPCVVVYNNPKYHYIGVILPRIIYDEETKSISFGECRIESGTYLHREHFRLARSNKLLINTMRAELISQLKKDTDPLEFYHVCRVNKHDLKNSGRHAGNMQENLKIGLTLSDHIILNPVFNFSECINE